jgi:hypothetical protein
VRRASCSNLLNLAEMFAVAAVAIRSFARRLRENRYDLVAASQDDAHLASLLLPVPPQVWQIIGTIPNLPKPWQDLQISLNDVSSSVVAGRAAAE